MKKMTTLFVVEYDNHKRLLKEDIRPENGWVFEKGVKVTVKFDGTATLVKEGVLYKRYDAKAGKTPPEGAVPCQDAADPVTGHFPHWVKVSVDNPADKWFLTVDTKGLLDGTYEFCGTKVGGNKESIDGHALLRHGSVTVDLDFCKANAFEVLKAYLAKESNDIEGFVFHHKDGRRCKVRKTDFGFKR